MTSEPILLSANGKSFQGHTNPSFSQLSEIGSLVRSTADSRTKTVYVWDFKSGHHTDVSIGLKLDDPFDSIDFLKGHAGRNDDGKYEMAGSDFLESFFGKLTERDKSFLYNLLRPKWDWVDNYIKVTGWISSLRELLRL
jgi:WD40 repeat protein